MHRKGTYLKRFINEHGAENIHHAAGKRIVVSDEVKAQYEEGAMIVIDKPVHWTSFDVVKKIRTVLKIKKVGHAGTLDPLATGVLIICTGKFTKKINEFMAQEKEYTGTFTLGAVTPTYDLESTPEQQQDISHLQPEAIHETVKKFIGEIDQFPPIYSALKKEGTPLYELARRGEELKLQSRKILITSFEITAIEMPLVHFKISCSTGTYIRSIAHDFGKALGCGAYLSSLCRSKIGSVSLDDADTIDAWLDKVSISAAQ